ncbi:MAG: hypothetical protein HY901_20705 [Deltaproteobacteria bacterium]|nr:hypothetical protein [Deltaproteobacteria bacterium]
MGADVTVWCEGWITCDSGWEAHGGYQVERFGLNVSKWNTAAGVCQVALPPIRDGVEPFTHQRPGLSRPPRQ